MIKIKQACKSDIEQLNLIQAEMGEFEKKLDENILRDKKIIYYGPKHSIQCGGKNCDKDSQFHSLFHAYFRIWVGLSIRLNA